MRKRYCLAHIHIHISFKQRSLSHIQLKIWHEATQYITLQRTIHRNVQGCLIDTVDLYSAKASFYYLSILASRRHFVCFLCALTGFGGGMMVCNMH